MHVLILPSYYPSQQKPITGIFFHEQAKALQKAGHRVGVLVTPRLNITLETLRRGGVRALKPTTREGYLTDYPVYRMHWGWFPRPFPPLASLLTAQAGLRAFDLYCREQGVPDVIHAHNIFYGGLLAVAIKRRSRVPVVLTEHSTSYMEGLIIFPGQPRIIAQTLEQVDAPMAVSQALIDAMQPYAPDVKLSVIDNIVDTTFFTPADPPAPSPFIFSIIGTLEPRKQHSVALEAFASVLKGKAAELRIGGTGGTQAKLEALAETLGIAPQIRFLGQLSRDQVRDELRRCHVLISCSLVESFGVTLIEAMACGKPVIATRSGGPEGFVQPDNGLLIPTKDVDALAAAISQIIDGYSAYDPARIRAFCTARFSEESVIRRLEAVYTSVITARA